MHSEQMVCEWVSDKSAGAYEERPYLPAGGRREVLEGPAPFAVEPPIDPKGRVKDSRH